jgi:hypothetical protein
MEQITGYRYRVEPGEKVTIRVTPVGVGPHVAAAENRTVLPNSGPAHTPTFRFGAHDLPGYIHFVEVDCSFDQQDDDDARYEFRISGSRGGSFENVRPVRKTHVNRSPVFRFQVES